MEPLKATMSWRTLQGAHSKVSGVTRMRTAMHWAGGAIGGAITWKISCLQLLDNWLQCTLQWTWRIGTLRSCLPRWHWLHELWWEVGQSTIPSLLMASRAPWTVVATKVLEFQKWMKWMDTTLLEKILKSNWPWLCPSKTCPLPSLGPRNLRNLRADGPAGNKTAGSKLRKHSEPALFVWSLYLRRWYCHAVGKFVVLAPSTGLWNRNLKVLLPMRFPAPFVRGAWLLIPCQPSLGKMPWIDCNKGCFYGINLELPEILVKTMLCPIEFWYALV